MRRGKPAHSLRGANEGLVPDNHARLVERRDPWVEIDVPHVVSKTWQHVVQGGFKLFRPYIQHLADVVASVLVHVRPPLCASRSATYHYL